MIIMMRGDANSDGVVDGADATRIANHLFLGGPAPPCRSRADADNSGAVGISDSIYILNWLFSGGPEPPYLPGTVQHRVHRG